MRQTLPVHWLESKVWEEVLDGERIIERQRWVLEWEEMKAKAAAGEPLGDDSGWIRERLQQLRDDNPGLPIHYRLPAHWHWMGDGVHPHKMPHVNGRIAWYPNSAVRLPFLRQRHERRRISSDRWGGGVTT